MDNGNPLFHEIGSDVAEEQRDAPLLNMNDIKGSKYDE